MEQERKRLLSENEQYKLHVENLKQCINEQSTAVNSVETPSTTKSSSPKRLEDMIQSPVDLDQSEDGVVEKLRSRGEKLINELKKAEEPLCVNILTLVANSTSLNNYKEEQEAVYTEENQESGRGNDSDYSGRGRALDTDNDQALDSERVDNDKIKGKGLGGNIEGALREAVAESLGPALKRIGNEFKNILDGYTEAYGKTKLREKEVIARVKNETVSKAKNEEYEQEIIDLQEKLSETKSTLNRTKAELEEKVKVLERTKKHFEENYAAIEEERKQFEEAMEEGQAEIDSLNENIGELKQIIGKRETTIKELEEERHELHERAKLIEKEYRSLNTDKEKSEKDIRQELLRHQSSIKDLTDEKTKLEKKLTNSGHDNMSIENSLIQEKLKHHQTMADLAKIKEKLEEMEKNLNDEIEARKGDILKNDALKKRIVEAERKGKEYKKTIKNLSQQLLDLHNKRAKENEEKMKNEQPNKTESVHELSEQEETEAATQEAASDKAEIINTQYAKIQMLEEKLEDLQKEVQGLLKKNENLQKDNTESNSQVRILKEKREIGLQEIKRLNMALDQLKSGGQLPDMTSPLYRQNSGAGKVPGFFSPITATSPGSANNLGTMPNAVDLKNLRRIKKGLDEVYKEIILTITNEKMHESGSDKKATGKFGELVKGPLPSDNFMKIEKKMNDTIVLFQEYMENFE